MTTINDEFIQGKLVTPPPTRAFFTRERCFGHGARSALEPLGESCVASELFFTGETRFAYSRTISAITIRTELASPRVR
jgi:hypothetical protein|tara:strand:+ start:95 stop:331 length:237 start_codon:yes stop_codon:yes gene_type:complete